MNLSCSAFRAQGFFSELDHFRAIQRPDVFLDYVSIFIKKKERRVGLHTELSTDGRSFTFLHIDLEIDDIEPGVGCEIEVLQTVSND